MVEKEIEDIDTPEFKTVYNNPEEVAKYLKEVNRLTDKFMNDIAGFDCYAQEGTYEWYVQHVYLELKKLDPDYFKNASIKLVFDLMDDKRCKAFLAKLVEPDKDKIEKWQATENVQTGHATLAKLTEEPHTPLNDKSQAIVVKLFRSLQKAHSNLAEVARHIVELGEHTTPEQFGSMLKFAVHPLIQMKILPHMCFPAALKFDCEHLTPEESFEESYINTVLPHPYHPKLAKVEYKHSTQCLVATIHMLLRKHMFNTKVSQMKVVELFAVHPKKLYMSCSGHKYSPGKKPSKRQHHHDKTEARSYSRRQV